MSEYIIEVEYDTLNGTFTQMRHEEIVRCRDCKFCMSYWGADYCDYFSHVTNDPDGYCVWGERRADHD